MKQFVIKTHFALNLYLKYIGVEGVTLAVIFWFSTSSKLST